jgi:hypothetical protein
VTEYSAAEVKAILASALIFAVCVPIGASLVIAANGQASSIYREVNSQLPEDAQFNQWDWGARPKSFEVLRLHSKMYPESPKRWQMWALSLSGYAIGLGVFVALCALSR